MRRLLAFLVCGVAAEAGGPWPEMDLPAVSFRDLQRPAGFGHSALRHAFAELGAVEITDVPGFAAARLAGLEGVARCLAVAPSLEVNMSDGTLRSSFAAETSAAGVLGALDYVTCRPPQTLTCHGLFSAPTGP